MSKKYSNFTLIFPGGAVFSLSYGIHYVVDFVNEFQLEVFSFRFESNFKCILINLKIFTEIRTYFYKSFLIKVNL